MFLWKIQEFCMGDTYVLPMKIQTMLGDIHIVMPRWFPSLCEPLRCSHEVKNQNSMGHPRYARSLPPSFFYATPVAHKLCSCLIIRHRFGFRSPSTAMKQHKLEENMNVVPGPKGISIFWCYELFRGGGPLPFHFPGLLILGDLEAFFGFFC